MEMPLAGIKVLDLSTMYPGPVCTMTLADFGAEVIRVEPTKGGDLWRYSLPLVNGLGMPYLQVNRNKKSICLNLKDPEAKEIFYRLVKDADVVVEQYRPGVAQRLGVDYDTLKKLNEKIVYCSISGFGQTGPYRLLAGHDINYISYAGILGLTARKGECPVLPGVQIGDVSGGALYAVIGILMALMGVKQTGKGQYIDTAMFDGAVSMMHWNASSCLAGGEEMQPQGNILIGQLACYNVYETKDGGKLALGMVEPKFWEPFCDAIGHPEIKPTGLMRRWEAPEAFEIVEEKTGKNALEVFEQAMENVMPSLEVKARRVGGANYQVPIEVRPERRQTLGLRWMASYSRLRSEKTMKERLAGEILDALNGAGGAAKKRDDTHKMAEANKAFAHYRW